MFRLVIASSILCAILGDSILVESFGLGKHINPSKRIVGGYPTEIHDFPWIVSVQTDNRHICGGSILSETIILTAARCAIAHPPDSLSVLVGSSRVDKGGSRHRLEGFKVHENYTRSSFTSWHDVALIKVRPPIKFSESVTNVCLPKAGDVVAPGTEVSLAGWGRMHTRGRFSKALMYTNLRIVDHAKCSRDHSDDSGTFMSSHGLICAAGPDADTCNGDSGGPLTVGCLQVGVVSTGRSCARSKNPGIYADVAFHLDWITKNSMELDQSPGITRK